MVWANNPAEGTYNLQMISTACKGMGLGTRLLLGLRVHLYHCPELHIIFTDEPAGHFTYCIITDILMHSSTQHIPLLEALHIKVTVSSLPSNISTSLGWCINTKSLENAKTHSIQSRLISYQLEIVSKYKCLQFSYSTITC